MELAALAELNWTRVCQVAQAAVEEAGYAMMTGSKEMPAIHAIHDQNYNVIWVLAVNGLI